LPRERLSLIAEWIVVDTASSLNLLVLAESRQSRHEKMFTYENGARLQHLSQELAYLCSDPIAPSGTCILRQMGGQMPFNITLNW